MVGWLAFTHCARAVAHQHDLTHVLDHAVPVVVQPMKITQKGRSGPAIGAAVTIVLLVVSGIGYRVTAGWFDRAVVGAPLPVGSLGAVPLQVGDWFGEDVPMDDAIIKRTDTDDHINRIYRRRETREGVSVFAGCGVKLRDLMPHRPTVCYIGGGWTLDQSKTVQLDAAGVGTLPCVIYTFYRSGLDSARIAVLNYYIVDGQYSEDVSLLRSKARSFGIGATYMAQIQIAARGGQAGSGGEDAVLSFAKDSAAAFRKALETASEALQATRAADVQQSATPISSVEPQNVASNGDRSVIRPTSGD